MIGIEQGVMVLIGLAVICIVVILILNFLGIPCNYEEHHEETTETRTDTITDSFSDTRDDRSE